ncbi:MAG TPA: hypothetical protein VHY22_05460 [Chthoniobacteraceae bacterium]|jgi:hypothetical protein|nr:hypothetical protein [Chthoniobacteraceae bacterium]
MKYIVSVSGGKGSYEAWRRCIEQKGRENTVGVFADVGRIARNGETVCGEDDDLYRFLDDIERSLDSPLHRIASPLYTDIWDVFFKNRMLGSTLRDPCSRWLKRKVLADWRISNFGRVNTVVVLGLSWQERGRIVEFQSVFGDACWFPCCEEPFVTYEQIDEELASRGIAPPAIHGEGFSHNNCGGFCVKMGLYQCYLLWRHRLARWMFAEEKEMEFRAYLGRDDVTIFRKDDENITMRELRWLFESGYVPKKRKQRSCAACMLPTVSELLFKLT